jgi:hypothetical protein
MATPDLPPCAMVETDGIEGPTFRPVEAPPCGHRLDIDDRNVHLVCDHLPGHHARGAKHRAVIDATAGYALYWCWDDCANKCEHVLANCLAEIQADIRKGWADG